VRMGDLAPQSTQLMPHKQCTTHHLIATDLI